MTPSYSTDIVIFGGGIAGLWLLDRLRNEGYQAILLESRSLGGGQTYASQGIIHGGLKYALRGPIAALKGGPKGGSIGDAAHTIADMPARWRSCLAGTGDVDLRGTHLLSEHYYMWSESGFRSKLKTFLGSKNLRGRVTAVAEDDYPDFFRQTEMAGTLYRLPDFVIDTPTLIKVLADRQREYIFKIDPESVSFGRSEAGLIDSLTLTQRDQCLQIRSQRIVFCAGEGNQRLIQQASLKSVATQTRPLKMVMVSKSNLPPVYVHCIGNNFSLTPKLTITSHVNSSGETVWYLGGEIAESGVAIDDELQIKHAQRQIRELFSWVDFHGAHWQCLSINRAEANINNSHRPDDACYVEECNVISAWPTKLTLTPALADKLVEHFAAGSMKPLQHDNEMELRSNLSRPQFAAAYWD